VGHSIPSVARASRTRTSATCVADEGTPSSPRHAPTARTDTFACEARGPRSTSRTHVASASSTIGAAPDAPAPSDARATAPRTHSATAPASASRRCDAPRPIRTAATATAAESTSARGRILRQKRVIAD
jgi:hypothetical protein